ncbi:Uma2 family endonuclease [Microcoleus sp. CAWBG58]|uniref:Uma2 family endonuclease n=1 Tax=Microcoleus sp. CAWBG58 TaxID=2841651 RepID=UPI0025FB6C9F|nr:Uma2 family endonuclease [Microcoleus sp. CAWBG58]
MVVPTKSTISLAEFLQLPETKPASEYIDGQIYQKPMPQGKHSKLQDELLSAINQLGKPTKLAHAFPELRCTFGGRSIVPDIAVFEWSRIPLDEDGEIANRIEIPPDWIIEILSPDQSPNPVIKKILFSIRQGTKLGWFADPRDRSVITFQPNQMPEFISGTDLLPVLSVLEDWQLSATELFSLLKIN